MRRFLLAALMLGAASGARAADMPDFLRGSFPAVTSAPTRNWDGWYAGGQAGYTSGNMDYSNTLGGVANNIFSSSAAIQSVTSGLNVLGTGHGQGPGFGGFVGRNYQFDDIVLGVEANYNYLSNIASSAAAAEGPVQVAEPNLVLPTGDTAADGVTLAGTAALKIKDELSFRGRAGWATGNFMPYMFGGLAVARMDATLSVTPTVNRTIYNSSGGQTTFPLTQFEGTTVAGRSNNLVVGWTAGLGMEYMLWDNVFLRAEWEYASFMKVENIAATLTNVRAGIGYKF